MHKPPTLQWAMVRVQRLQAMLLTTDHEARRLDINTVSFLISLCTCSMVRSTMNKSIHISIGHGLGENGLTFYLPLNANLYGLGTHFYLYSRGFLVSHS